MIKSFYGLILITLAFLLQAGSVRAGTHGPIIVYHLDRNYQVEGELVLKPVEIWGDYGIEHYGYGVFTKWLRPSQGYDQASNVTYPQANRAYFDNLAVNIKTHREEGFVEVFLDYTRCHAELKKIEFKSELENIIDGTGAALLYTYQKNTEGRIKKVILHVTGYRGYPKPFQRRYEWGKLDKKWKPVYSLVDPFKKGVQRSIVTREEKKLTHPLIDIRIDPLLQEGTQGPGVYDFKNFEIQVVVTNLGDKKIALDTDPDKELPGGNGHLWRFEVEPLGKKGGKATPFPYKIENTPSSKNGFVFLKPGKAFKRNLSLGKQYEIKSPGRYRIRLLYEYREGYFPGYTELNVPAGSFTSNPIEIELFR